MRAASASGPGLRGITSSCSIMMGMDKNPTMKRDIRMARDCYDDCIAFLDEQLVGCSTSYEARGFSTTPR